VKLIRVVTFFLILVRTVLAHPQWSDSTALGVIHHILSDNGSDICCFFVGSYRSNEVSSDHALFGLMNDLEASKVSTQKLMLEGVKYEDMNTLISDALCTFPRTTWRLTNIIYEKTQGSKSKSCD
jgi:predicted ATPase